MIQKILLFVVLAIGALLTYLAEPVGKFVKISKNSENNIVFIKAIGFIIVLLAVIITFVKF